MIEVDEVALIEFFGVAPEPQDEDEREFFAAPLFRKRVDGLELRFSVSANFGDLRLDLRRIGHDAVLLALVVPGIRAVRVERWRNRQVLRATSETHGVVELTIEPTIEIHCSTPDRRHDRDNSPSLPPGLASSSRQAGDARNSMLVIHPYRAEGMWVFDDERAGLVQEPFVSGADRIIDRLVASIPDAASGFVLLFSAAPFPGYQAELAWQRSEHGGNWYSCAELNMEGWLCPALFQYFAAAPRQIFVQCKPRASQ